MFSDDNSVAQIVNDKLHFLMSFNQINTVEQTPDDSCRFVEACLKWSNLVAIAKF